MPERPTGTVTFLFTDIEGSTRLWDTRPDDMRLALARHDELVRRGIAAHAGYVFSTGGDGVVAAFTRATDALAAAVEVQRSIGQETFDADTPIRVRIGLHIGESYERDGDYFGPAVNLAARVMALAQGGQVTMSSVVAEVVRPLLPIDWSLHDTGYHELRGFARPERVYALAWPGADVLPPVSVAGRRGNLPRQVRHVVGRARDLDALVALLATEQLVTLTGVGGAGKTTLAVAAAHRVADRYADGAWFVDLAGATNSEEVLPAIAGALGVRPSAGLSLSECVLRLLAARQCLLVLDNCEHVLQTAGDTVESVLDRAHGVTVLTTSREGLGLSEERIVAVRPLDQQAAAELFEFRVAGAVSAPPSADSHLVAELCQRLDGLPLAIELAAARARSMPLQDLVDRLDERFRLLRGTPRGADRHQTLRATVAWSYELLRADEQQVFDRLSVFTGGFTMEAAEAVCGDDTLEATTIADRVVALAEKSMVVPAAGGRYRLLETMRQFGEEQLAATDRPDDLRDAHLCFMTSLVERCHEGLLGRDPVAWLQRLHDDWPNIRSAFAWALHRNDVNAAATLATRLTWAAFWHDLPEPYTWIETVLGRCDATCPIWHDVLAAAAWAAWEDSRNDLALSLGRQALAAEPPGVHTIDLFADFAVLSAAGFQGAWGEAEDAARRALARLTPEDPAVFAAWQHVSIALLTNLSGRSEEAMALFEVALDLAEAAGNPTIRGWAAVALGNAELALGRDGATARLADAVEQARRSRSPIVALNAHFGLARAHLTSEHFELAVPALLEALLLVRQRRTWVHRVFVLGARVLTVRGRAEAGARLAGAIDRGPLRAAFASHLEALDQALSAALPAERLRGLLEAGSRLSLDDAVLLAETTLRELLLTTPR